ncbi:MAG: hypothetical protein HY075_09020 [Deltaproteobacteria bacterium]|nr:hypothetical protein [Deltaproteobacteria bacterium]
MTYALKNRAFYVYLALAAAALVPVMAHADGTADDGDGPSISVIKTDDKAVDPAKKKDEDKDKKDDKAPGKSHADNYGMVGGQVGGSSPQGFAVGAVAGYSGDHEGTSANATLGSNKGDVFGVQATVNGLRTNGNSEGSVTVAGVANGSASVTTSGQGTANGVGAAAIIIPIRAADLDCMVGVGPAAGGMYSNQLAGTDASGNQIETKVAGPGGYASFGCQGKAWKVDLFGHGIFNAMHQGDSTKADFNESKAAMQLRLNAMLRVNKNMAVGGYAQMDGDARDSKFVPGFSGGVQLVYTFGDGGKVSGVAGE